MTTISNLMRALPDASAAEVLDTLLQAPGIRIERIVSQGQATPPDFWYDQPWSEWVLLVSGSAGIQLEGEEREHHLLPGDHLLIPPRRRHRVTRTDADRQTVWLAVHFGAVGEADNDSIH